jgi:hypothetical protein
MNTRTLCLALLNILDDADEHPLAEQVIGEHLTLRVGAQPKGVMEAGLITLQGRSHARPMDKEFDDDETRWVITDKGRGWLKANGL